MSLEPEGHVSAPMTVGQILERSFALYRGAFPLMAGALAAVQIPFQATLALLLPSLETRKVPSPGGGGHPTSLALAAAHEPTALAGLGLLALLLYLLLGIPLQWAALTRLAAARWRGQPVSLGGAYRTGIRRWLPLLGMLVLALVITAFVAAVLVLLGFILSALLGEWGRVLAVLVGIAALVVGIWACLRLGVAMPVVVLEPVDPWRAMSRSWSLTRGGAGRVLGLLLLLTVLAGLVASFITAVFGALASGHPLSEVTRVVGAILASVVSPPLIGCGVVLLYFDLMARARPAGEPPLPPALDPWGAAPA